MFKKEKAKNGEKYVEIQQLGIYKINGHSLNKAISKVFIGKFNSRMQTEEEQRT